MPDSYAWQNVSVRSDFLDCSFLSLNMPKPRTSWHLSLYNAAVKYVTMYHLKWCLQLGHCVLMIAAVQLLWGWCIRVPSAGAVSQRGAVHVSACKLQSAGGGWRSVLPGILVHLVSTNSELVQWEIASLTSWVIHVVVCCLVLSHLVVNIWIWILSNFDIMIGSPLIFACDSHGSEVQRVCVCAWSSPLPGPGGGWTPLPAVTPHPAPGPHPGQSAAHTGYGCCTYMVQGSTLRFFVKGLTGHLGEVVGPQRNVHLLFTFIHTLQWKTLKIVRIVLSPWRNLKFWLNKIEMACLKNQCACCTG